MKTVQLPQCWTSLDARHFRTLLRWCDQAAGKTPSRYGSMAGVRIIPNVDRKWCWMIGVNPKGMNVAGFSWGWCGPSDAMTAAQSITLSPNSVKDLLKRIKVNDGDVRLMYDRANPKPLIAAQYGWELELTEQEGHFPPWKDITPDVWHDHPLSAPHSRETPSAGCKYPAERLATAVKNFPAERVEMGFTDACFYWLHGVADITTSRSAACGGQTACLSLIVGEY